MKLVIDEAQTADARALTDAADVLITSPIAYAEVRAALGRSRAEGRFGQADLHRASRELDQRWTLIAKVDLSDTLAQSAGEIAERHVLQALDALHIASALAFAERAVDAITFVSWDRRQRAGAAAEGLALFPERI